MTNTHSKSQRPFVGHVIRIFSLPIVLLWVLLVVALGAIFPSLDDVAATRSVPLSPTDSQAYQSMLNIGKVFRQYDSDSTAMVVLEGEDKLGDAAHKYYDEIVAKLRADHEHVQNVQDFWSDPLTAAGSQSVDGRSAYVQIFLNGPQGTTASYESVAAVRDIVESVPPPPGIKAHVAGTTVLNADTSVAGHQSMARMELISVAVIILMLLAIYRSIVTMLISMVIIGLELFAAQSVTATAGHFNLIGLTPYAVSMTTMLALAAGTDYVIFLLGRYHEERSRGLDREEAYYVAYRGVSHVILGSGLTIAGACLCLTMTTLPYFQSMALPCAISILVIVIAALTLAPAVLTVASRFGLLDPKRELSTKSWRKVGTAVVRWPIPIILVTGLVAAIGFASLLTYVPQYNDQKFTPADMPANVAMAVADRHFSEARMNPELLMLEADHDIRNPADMLVIDRVAKYVVHMRGIERVQTITRPLGSPIEHSSIPFLLGAQNAGTMQAAKFNNDNTAQMLEQADELSRTIASMERMYGLTQELTDTTHSMVGRTHDMVEATKEMRDSLADFDDFFRPMRNYLYWEPHCYDIPVCQSLRSVFDTLDGIGQLTDEMQGLTIDMDRMDELMPQMLPILRSTIDSMKTMRDFMIATHSVMAGTQAQQQELAKNATEIGLYFDQAKNDDFFYLPPDVFDNPDFKRGLEMFVSPDGKAVRMIITHQGDPASVDGIAHVRDLRDVVADAVKGTPLANAKVSLAGTASLYSDMQDGVVTDLMIAIIASMILIFGIMLVITRSVVAALVIVGTVAASLGTACGLSVLLWQDILGLGVQWVVLPLSIVILLAVGSDYNLLLVSRLKEEIHAGLNTGIIRGMGATGRVVTAAGLVFAFTMMAMIVSDLRVVGQLGTTIGLGLIVDTLIVRAFMTPSIAAALGRWFWWPLNTFEITRRGRQAPHARSVDGNTQPFPGVTTAP
ncbi:MMPL/RND family transporter [Mycolicibacterium smegmatis]|uniref:Transmembrane transport protein MmpL1 n=2 Tax=Mycolicibacterium smegmatis (strain ATCC 700084 / mc(2)155) TaxID=246196 RepID=I7G1V7_MYCS2|nr:RND family transporter [Mycolicibacterium smegmatis]ABK72603.1 MmpL4 protein [Mycolicibacterium smegmatis MC2 155]AFP36931.1 Transmembrane transport protein MmpL1 [Mycolicibacterium smegmatis MC2 155]MBE9620438.1 RND family transporter [Mycolicibacterium smegmatis]MBE9626771.1 RND family transporter [Mycolicibacterium smegmatis]MBE9633268.1 RND family transporter [Mycolicibacterium smegmatis]